MAKAIRLTPPMVELLTDLVTNPAMYVTRYSRWDRTATALVDRGLAQRSSGYAGARQAEVTITQAGRDEVARRGIRDTAPHPAAVPELFCLHRADVPKPTLTRPALPVVPRLVGHDGYLYGADPTCTHYVTYGLGGSGVRCIRCGGWFCA